MAPRQPVDEYRASLFHGGVQPGSGAPADETTRPAARPNGDAAAGPMAAAPAGDQPVRKAGAAAFLPAPSLPTGGGAIRGMGETFAVNPARGTGALSVPLPLSPGRGAVTPELALSYDSGAGNSPFGLGFAVRVPSISRRTQRGIPRYRDDDTFVLSGFAELVPALDGSGQEDSRPDDIDGVPHLVTRYRPRTDNAMSRIERCDPVGGGPAFWRTVSRDNITSVFGRDPTARVFDPTDSSRVFEWLLQEVRDDRGNVIVYEYKPEDLNGVDPRAAHEAHRVSAPAPAGRYLKYVRYANRAPGDPTTCALTIVLDYGDHDVEAPTPQHTGAWPVRSDAFSTYRPGFEVRIWRLCRRVLMFHDFAELGAGPLPRLVRSVEFGYHADPGVTKLASVTQTGYLWQDSSYQRSSLPPLELSYTQAGPDTVVRCLDTVDGAPLAGGPDSEGAYWVDLDGDGLPGALTRHAGGWWYQRNLGEARLGARRLVSTAPSVGHDGPLHLTDVDGAGRIALVEWGPDRFGFAVRDPDGEHGWGPYTPFTSVPLVDLADSRLRRIDLDGDGLPDLLFTEGETLRWHRNLGREGFGPPHSVLQGSDEARAPMLLVGEHARSVYLADMTGDGLTDLVRVRNGEVCYWPNLGHGRFGPMVVMSSAPVFDHPEQFDASRIRLGDVDGTGPADIVYLSRDGVRWWRNLAGNGFASGGELAPFPECDQLSSVELTDLLGTGTACLVWSSPSTRDDTDRVRYLDLCRGDDPALDPDDPRLAGRKPHLLCRAVNNLGAERRVSYAPSTRHCLAAALSDEPWLTRLPFPVQVVDQVETVDLVSGTRLVSRHRYWHGYFDGVEREFRGFGLAETVDAESVPGPPGPPADDDVDLPPVRTRSWFHLGAYPDLTATIAAGYWSGDPVAVPLPANEVVRAQSGEELREGYRALAGAPLRTEVYADDGTAAARYPYAVTVYRHRAERLQPRRDEDASVFRTHGLETVTYHYERDPADPRVGHELILDVDTHGTVRLSATVGYRRRHPEISDQAQTLVTLAVTDVTHTSNGMTHRLDTPVASQVYEVTGLPDPGADRYSYETLHTALTGSLSDLPFEGIPTAGLLQRRLIQSMRIRYWNDDLTAELAAGDVGARALPRQSHQLAFTPGLLQAVLGGHVTADLLAIEGGYLLDEGAWWIPSGVQIYDPTAFFLPVELRDPFGTTSSVAYDAYHLLPIATKAAQVAPHDVLTSTMENDYRVLAPREITDPNGNRRWVACDALGAVVAAGRSGRLGEQIGDSAQLPGVVYGYDVDEWRLHGRPIWAHAEIRERHGDPASPWQRRRVYSDGFGRAVMTKEQAEPGPAWTLDTVGQAVQIDTTPKVRWVGTGRTVFNNKGLPVAKYEPYFSATFEYEDDDALVKQGVTARLRYDPLGRVVRTDFPDGTLSRAEFDPWHQVSWDANDTVLESSWYAERGSPDPATENEPTDPRRRAAWLAARHAATPTVSTLDSLGRVVRTLADNGTAGQYQTTVVLDVEGNTRSVTDPRGVVVLRQFHDVAGRVLHSQSPDAGPRWLLPDVAGSPLRRWDGRGAVIWYEYDAVRRPTHTWVRRDPAKEKELAVLTIYGEAHPEAVQRNLRGRAWRSYDGAGYATIERADFKGNVLAESRRLAAAVQPAPDWCALAGLPLSALDTAATPPQVPGFFAVSVEYDALDRATSRTLPDDTVIVPSYNEAGLLNAVSARLRGATTVTEFVTNVDYDAKGRREFIQYRNGASTRLSHDPLDFRLHRLETRRGSRVLQDLSYTYDAAGNIVEVTDGAQQTYFFDGQVVTPTARYAYDALYRLVHATGREHASISTQLDHVEPARQPLPHPNDTQATRRYAETYEYDEAGNIVRMSHSAGDTGSWTRRYSYATDSNQLLGHSRPGDPDGVYSATFSYDAHGCMASMPDHLPLIEWDVADLMATVDLKGGGNAAYGYDAAGQRVTKKVSRIGGLIEERAYLGAFEIYRRWLNGVLVFERQTVHIADDTGLVALVETVTVDTTPGAVTGVPRLRNQLSNHLGSSILELDDTGAVISYEEYHPYGTTSVWLATGVAEVSVKRYRYTGMERDDETGLCHHGARQYAPWLGRWTSPDPAGLVDSVNSYQYARGNPARLIDPTGTESEPPDAKRLAAPLIESQKRLDELQGLRRGKLTDAQRKDIEKDIAYINEVREAYARDLSQQYLEARAAAKVDAQRKRRQAEAELARRPAAGPGQPPHPDLVILEYQGKTEATTKAAVDISIEMGGRPPVGMKMYRVTTTEQNEPVDRPVPLKTEESMRIEAAVEQSLNRELPEQQKGRTDAVTGSGVVRNNSYDSPGAQLVYSRAGRMGLDLRRAGAKDYGYPGAAHASHAEKKVAEYARIRYSSVRNAFEMEPVEVNRDMCADCLRYFEARARADSEAFPGMTFRIIGPSETHIITPNWTAVLRPLPLPMLNLPANRVRR